MDRVLVRTTRLVGQEPLAVIVEIVSKNHLGYHNRFIDPCLHVFTNYQFGCFFLKTVSRRPEGHLPSDVTAPATDMFRFFHPF